ncbi:cytochrome P450 [Plantactinospora sp. KBS50]|uniref:cytochrome P450 n=1 Tax=Plantactinospora sp. KBS50 TaxID=2024580 RepID=UPI000BAAB6A6|nr:cytochrome P450 [Plantactinospora sp. KBS50]ASW54317.1 cytochrome P450 [Plantactinospora sp. KBS50]
MAHLPLLDPGEVSELDLTDAAVHAEYDLSALWRRLRTHAPLHRHRSVAGGPEFWVVTRHADAMAVFRDGQRFTSTSGNVLETLLVGSDSAAGKMLAVTDGNRHTEVRRVITGALTPAVLDRLADRIRTQIRGLVARAVERVDGDFGTDVAAQVPLTTICDMLAVPDSDRAYIHRLGSSSVSSHEPGHDTMDAWTSKNELLAYFLDLAEQRRADPGDDLVSVLATARVKGRPLGTDEIVFNCYSLILGGDETTRLAMTGAVLAMAENPDQWRAFQRGEVAIDSAVEEVLRWTTPSRHLGRLAIEPAEIAGGRIEAGDIVTVWLASANFDEREFAEPDAFRLDRSPNRHLTFAYGPHFCVGARLARIQLEATLTALRDLVGDIEVTGAPQRVYSNFIGGTFTLPVRLKAA